MGARALHGPAPAADHAQPSSRYGYIGRPERASPGEGYPAAHAAGAEPHRAHRARSRRSPLSPYPVKTPGER